MKKGIRVITLSETATKWLEEFYKENPTYCSPLKYQPERSKREDHHLTLDDFSPTISTQELGNEMKKVERKILEAVL